MAGAWQYIHPEATVNLETNPSFETGMTGWAASTGITTLERVSDRAMFGTYCAHVTGTKSSQTIYWFNTAMAITPLETYTLSAYLQANMGTTSTDLIRMNIYWQTSSAGTIETGYTTMAAGNSTTWVRYILTDTPTFSSATQARVVFTIYGACTGSTFHCYMDGFQFE